MTASIAVAAALALGALQDPSGRIEELIRQLGAEEYAEREKATAELRKLGRAAEEALRKAAESGDPEVQSRARNLLRDLENPPAEKEKKEPLRDEARPRRGVGGVFGGFRGGSLSVRSVDGDTTYTVTPADGRPPFTLHRRADGSVRLEYEEGGEKKSAEAPSMERFLKDHKALAERFGITEQGIDYGGLRSAFGWRFGGRAFRVPPGGPPFRLGDLLEEEDEEGARRVRAAGAALERPSETVRAQLGIPEGQGWVVAEVEKGGAAAAAGLLRHDILLEIDGRPAASPEDVRDRLPGASTVLVIRKGTRREFRIGRRDF